MSEIKNSGLDQYGSGPSEQQQFGTAGVEGVNVLALKGLMCASAACRAASGVCNG